jgi:hypothetical protein
MQCITSSKAYMNESLKFIFLLIIDIKLLEIACIPSYVLFKGLQNSNLLFRLIQIKVHRLNHNRVSLLLLTNSSQTWFICLNFLLWEFICWGNKSQELFNYLTRSLLRYCWQKTIPLLFSNKFLRMKSSAYYNLN